MTPTAAANEQARKAQSKGGILSLARSHPCSILGTHYLLVRKVLVRYYHTFSESSTDPHEISVGKGKSVYKEISGLEENNNVSAMRVSVLHAKRWITGNTEESNNVVPEWVAERKLRRCDSSTCGNDSLGLPLLWCSLILTGNIVHNTE